jgi:hypothetical protein
MATIYLMLKVSALLVTLVLPLRKGRVRVNKNHIELSDWVVNEKGLLENMAEKHSGNHPIKIRH